MSDTPQPRSLHLETCARGLFSSVGKHTWHLYNYTVLPEVYKDT
jgi:hypothetical protein